MKIAVVGAGNVGGNIGARWQAAGHEVAFGLRDPSKRQGARTIEEALTGASAVLLALPGRAVVDFVKAQAVRLDGKLVIDATNNFGAPSFHSWPAISAALPKAQLYRAFNTYGFDVFVEPTLAGEKPDLFYCGPDGPGRATVEKLIGDVGLGAVWVGGVEQVDTVDGVLRLWYVLAGKRGRRIGFRLLSDSTLR